MAAACNVLDAMSRVVEMMSGPHMPAMPLSLAHSGDTVTVTRVRGGVTIKGARFGLDSKVASHVMTV